MAAAASGVSGRNAGAGGGAAFVARGEVFVSVVMSALQEVYAVTAVSADRALASLRTASDGAYAFPAYQLRARGTPMAPVVCRIRIAEGAQHLVPWPGMVVLKGFEPPDLIVATLGGVVTPREQASFLDWVRGVIRANGPVRLLVVLDDFVGWHFTSLDHGTSWLSDDEGVSKVAIVGARERRIAVLTALAQPLRTMPIRYFETEEAARTWLS
jgi:hypothetical protein